MTTAEPGPESRLNRAVRVAREHAASANAALEFVHGERPTPPAYATVAEAQELLDQVVLALDRLVR